LTILHNTVRQECPRPYIIPDTALALRSLLSNPLTISAPRKTPAIRRHSSLKFWSHRPMLSHCKTY